MTQYHVILIKFRFREGLHDYITFPKNQLYKSEKYIAKIYEHIIVYKNKYCFCRNSYIVIAVLYVFGKVRVLFVYIFCLFSAKQ